MPFIFRKPFVCPAIVVGALLLGTGLAGLVRPVCANESPATPALTADSPADDVLDALDRRGQALASFDAAVSLVERDESTQLESTRTGRVWYQKRSEGNERIRVLFDHRLDARRQFDEKIEYLLDKGWLLDRDYQKRIEVRRQVVRPGEKLNLLKLGEGPFPLPIGQKKEDVKKLFGVKKLKAAKDDPPATVHLELKPVKGTQFAKKFGTIDVWVDLKTLFPRRIATLDVRETTTRSTDLTDVRVNADTTDADFTPDKIDTGKWNIHEEPFKE